MVPKVVCFPAILSPAEAPCWSSCRCRFRPKGEKAGKMLVPFIHHLHIGEGWQESCQLPLGKSTGCALSLPRPLAVLGQCFVLPISTASGLGNLGWRDGVSKWAVWGGAPLCAPLVPPHSSASLPVQIMTAWGAGHCQLVRCLRGCC